jgi:hypothetical protein
MNSKTVDEIVEELLRRERERVVVEGEQKEKVYRKFVVFVPGDSDNDRERMDKSNGKETENKSYEMERVVPVVVEDNNYKIYNKLAST